jgi:hypothetical protein
MSDPIVTDATARDLTAAINRLAAAIEGSRAPLPTVGRCMRMPPDIFGAEHRMSCILPFAHLGVHTDGTGHWSRETDAGSGPHPDSPTAKYGPAPKGYICAAGCGHDTAIHRDGGCDLSNCDCPAPGGRLVPAPDVPDDASSITGGAL